MTHLTDIEIQAIADGEANEAESSARRGVRPLPRARGRAAA